jgi:hypothetical protein
MKGQVLPVPDIYTRASDFIALTKPRLNMLVINCWNGAAIN